MVGMTGGDHGLEASGVGEAVRDWDRLQKRLGPAQALGLLVDEIGGDRCRRLIREITRTHAVDVESMGDASIWDVIDAVLNSSRWSAGQLGDALVRAADVSDVRDAVDAIEGEHVEESIGVAGAGVRGRIESIVESTRAGDLSESGVYKPNEKGEMVPKLRGARKGLVGIADALRREGLDEAATHVEQAVLLVIDAIDRAERAELRGREIENAYSHLQRATETAGRELGRRHRAVDKMVDALNWMADVQEMMPGAFKKSR